MLASYSSEKELICKELKKLNTKGKIQLINGQIN
jgi:hypothetical protein